MTQAAYDYDQIQEPIFTAPRCRPRLLLLDQKTESAVKNYMPAREVTGAMANFFSVLGDPTRLKIISALSISGMCVGDLSQVLEINQTTLSHQLHNLKRSGIVDSFRQGKVVFYSIKNSVIQDILFWGLEFI